MASIINRNGWLHLRTFVQTGEIDPATGLPKRKEVRKALGLKKSDMALAKKIAKDYDRAVASTTFAPTTNQHVSVTAAFDLYLSRTTHKKTTTDIRRIFWSQFATFCSSIGIEDMAMVKPGDVARWQKLMLADKKATSVNDACRGCRAVWNHLVEMKLVNASNPFNVVKAIPEGRKMVKFIPWDNVARLLDVAEQHSQDAHLFVALGVLGGLRLSEILAQRWDDVDWTRGVMMVGGGTKTDASYDCIPIHSVLRGVLEKYRVESGYMVKPDHDMTGTPRERYNHRSMWRTVTKRAGLAGATPHQLRHTIATRLLDLGYTMAEVAVFLRHGDIDATKIYADLRGVGLKIGDVNG